MERKQEHETQAPEQTLRLAETSGMLRRIATAMVAEHGAYYCMFGGKRTKVIA